MLTNGSGNHAINIAEHVLGLMLAFARQLPALVRAQDERQWRPPPVETLFELSGQTLAVSAPAPSAAPSPSGPPRSACGCSACAARRPARCRPGSRR